MFPFKMVQFKAWCAELSQLGVSIAAVAKLPDGSVHSVGNTSLGLQAFSKLEKQKRRSSLSWVPILPLPLQKCPLSLYCKDLNVVR